MGVTNIIYQDKAIFSDGEIVIYAFYRCKDDDTQTMYKAKYYLIELDEDEDIASDNNYMEWSSIVSPPDLFYEFQCADFPRIVITDVGYIDEEYQEYYSYEFIKEIELNGNVLYMWEAI